MKQNIFTTGIKHHFFWLLAGMILFTLSVKAEQPSHEKVLEQLDQVIIQKALYRAERERALLQLKQQLHYATTEKEKYNLSNELFSLYLHYQADSALHYINKKAEYALLLNKPELNNEIIINRAEVMGVMGMYSEALDELQQIRSTLLSKKNLIYYYFTLRTCYGWLADYTVGREAKQKYLQLTDLYRDSIMNNIDSCVDRNIVQAERFILSSQPDKAIPMLNQMLTTSLDMKQKAYVNYTLSLAYEAKNETDMQIYYLAQTAIIDLSMPVREYASLQKLARLIYKKGDLKRAYSYLSCSMEDAVACNARLRFAEVTEFYPIIDHAYSQKEAQEKRMVVILLVCLGVLAILLIILALYLYYGLKKLSVTRKNLYLSNKELQAANMNLAQTGKIKEVYIARYLDRCVSYLDKLEQYRRSLEKLAMASRINDLFKAIRSEQFLRDERKNFYNEFDKSFLELFPNFIADFNNLLTDEGKIYPKPGEILNTELRIFALIRLGVTDANRIAHFLGYSLATVYNYRSKIRNRAKGDKDNFEQAVMEL